MMKLSTMRTVDSTVDTHGGSPIAEQILTSWDHEQGSVRFFRSSANFVYRFRQAMREDHSAGELRIELHIAGQGPFAEMSQRIKRRYILQRS